jgi:hypothetical protein
MENEYSVRTAHILTFFLQKGKREVSAKSEMVKTIKPCRGKAGAIGQIEEHSAPFPERFCHKGALLRGQRRTQSRRSFSLA